MNLILIRYYGVFGSALAVGLSWIPIWYLSDKATRTYSHGFDFTFFVKNLLLTTVIGGLSWYFITPLFVGISRVQGLVLMIAIALITILLFIVLNLKEGKLFFGELRKMKKGG